MKVTRLSDALPVPKGPARASSASPEPEAPLPQESFQAGPRTSPAAAPEPAKATAPPAPPASSPAPPSEAPSPWRAIGNQILSWVGLGDLVVSLRGELEAINELEASVSELRTPAQFAAKTAEFKARLAAGGSLESIRNEAYAVARQACLQALKMRPYDSQMLGALAMDRGRIAEMKTGEGKTLTAVMPAYLNALAGKGVHLITANETLAQRDCEQMAPAFQMLGLEAKTVLESMSPEEKRAAYNADVTYLTNSTLGFDFLRDRTVRDPAQRVQREPFFALVDEVDEVLIDEARVPLIISQRSQESQSDYGEFSQLVANMVAGDDFQIDAEKNQAFLTETGQDYLANRLGMVKAQRHLENAHKSNNRRAPLLAEAAQKRLKQGQQIETLIRQEQAAARALQGESDKVLRAARQTELEQIQDQKEQLQGEFPGFNLYHPAHMRQVPFLQRSLEARGLYRLDKDYTIALPQELEENLAVACRQLQLEPNQLNQARLLVAAHQLGVEPSPETLSLLVEQGPQLDHIVDDNARECGLAPRELLTQVYKKHAELKIVDEFKGRIADGRRFSDGLHQALEAKEGLEVQPEQRSVATITYPNLFRRYPRLAGMSGTAKVAEEEFRELYGLEVAEIPTHKPSQLTQQPDQLFATSEEKYRAIVQEARRCFEEGIPVLIGTRSVEINQKLTAMLQEANIPCQSLNADSIKHNTAKENAMLARAGQSGWVTVATNMAGRGVDIKEDQVNYKKAALTAASLVAPDRPVVIHVNSQKEADRLGQWLQQEESRGISITIDEKPRESVGVPSDGWNLPDPSSGPVHLKLSDFPTGGLRVLGSERHASRRIDLQLTGRAARQGRAGSAQFFLSLEDELLKYHGPKAPDISKLSGAKLDRFVSECQKRVGDGDYEARLDTTKFDQVMNLHRERYYELHEALVNSRPGLSEAPNNSDELVDVRATAGEWMRSAAQDEDWCKAMGLSQLPPQQRPDAIEKRFQDVCRSLVQESGFSEEQVDLFCWDAMLNGMDEAWTEHIEVMDSLKQNAQLQGDDEHKPIDIYKVLAFDAFRDCEKAFHQGSSSKILEGLEKTVQMARRLKLQ